MYRFDQNLDVSESDDPASCSTECQLTNDCSLFSYNTADQTWRLYREEAYTKAKFSYSDTTTIYSPNSLSLTHFWPFQSSMKDIIGQIDMNPV